MIAGILKKAAAQGTFLFLKPGTLEIWPYTDPGMPGPHFAAARDLAEGETVDLVPILDETKLVQHGFGIQVAR
jgi:hypothetical protein